MQAAGVPGQIGFAKRWELAADMITAAVEAAVPARWAAADEAYGNSSAFRSRLGKLGPGYVLAVSCDHLIPLDARRWNSWHRFTTLAVLAIGVADSHDPANDPVET